jgi:multiple sugar transport system permease protein
MSTLDTTAAGAYGRRRGEALKERARSWGFLAPSMAIVGLVTLYPLVYAIVLSLQHRSFIESGNWVGLHNFTELASNTQFLHALRFSAIFTVFSAFGAYVVGLGFALAVNRLNRGRWIARLGLLLPWVVPPVVSIIAWHWMLADNEAIANKALGFFGIGPITFLASPFWASVTVIVLRIWRSFPFIFITLLAARMAVPEELYEAAELDGANAWTTFRKITMPQLSRVSIVAVLLVAIWSFNDFETIYLLTKGGPANATYNVVVLSYYEAFFGSNLGLAAAMAVVGLVLLLALSAVLLRFLRRVDPA